MVVCFPGFTTHCDCIFTAQYRALASSCSRFLDHTQRRAAVDRTPLDEWSVRRRDLYLTTHNTHNRQTSVPPVGFKTTISAGERPEACALDRAATETGTFMAVSRRIILRMRNVSDKNCRESQNTALCPNFFFYKNLHIHEIMWKNMVQPGRPQIIK